MHMCKHRRRGITGCDAFPQGIALGRRHDHKRRYADDNSICFESFTPILVRLREAQRHNQCPFLVPRVRHDKRDSSPSIGARASDTEVSS
jgi:hypothetical protein